MDWAQKMTAAVNYIEEHINDNDLHQEISKIACCSMYQFGRVFSYTTGISLSEYIRRRRLTLAAFDLQHEECSVIDTSLKYGYDSPDSFSRVFKTQHGITPSGAKERGVSLSAFPPLSFKITITGALEVNYRLMEKNSFSIVGKVRRLNIHSTDDLFREKCMEVWNEFFDEGINSKLVHEYKLYRKPLHQIGLYRDLDNGKMEIAIGAEGDGNTYPDLDTLVVPKALWAVIDVQGKTPGSVDENWNRVLVEWLPTSGYRQSESFSMDSYPPGDADSDQYGWGIWLPVEKV